MANCAPEGFWDLQYINTYVAVENPGKRGGILLGLLRLQLGLDTPRLLWPTFVSFQFFRGAEMEIEV